MGKEPEVITFKELFEGNKNIPFEELCKMVLVCKNCDHKDLLKNFIKKVEAKWKKWDEPTMPRPDPNPYPYKPKPQKPWDDWKKWRFQNRAKQMVKKHKQMNNLMINYQEYEDLFYCPKCGSSLVVLCEDFRKNNILRGLENENNEKN